MNTLKVNEKINALIDELRTAVEEETDTLRRRKLRHAIGFLANARSIVSVLGAVERTVE